MCEQGVEVGVQPQQYNLNSTVHEPRAETHEHVKKFRRVQKTKIEINRLSRERELPLVMNNQASIEQHYVILFNLFFNFFCDLCTGSNTND